MSVMIVHINVIMCDSYDWILSFRDHTTLLSYQCVRDNMIKLNSHYSFTS